RVDLNSSVFDSPRLMSSSAWRWPRRYWSEHVLDDFAEVAVVRDALVEVEVRVDDLPDHVLDLRESDVFASVRASAGVEGGVGVEALHHLAQGHLVLGALGADGSRFAAAGTTPCRCSAAPRAVAPRD